MPAELMNQSDMVATAAPENSPVPRQRTRMPMEPRDLSRKGLDTGGEVIYVIDIPGRLAELQRVFPERRLYLYEREASSPKGTLGPLQGPGVGR